MKQKIVIKVCMPPCGKCRTRALKVVAKADGLISVAITGDEKLEVVGDDVDIACLVKCLRRKICYAGILQVEEVKNKKPEEKKPEEPKKEEQQPPPYWIVHPPPPSCPGYCSCHRCHLQPVKIVCDCEDPNSCAIM